jgi:hypothetical protein
MAEDYEPRWNAGAIGRIPDDDSLVYRDDAVFGPSFYCASPGQAEEAARMLSALQRCADALRALIRPEKDFKVGETMSRVAEATAALMELDESAATERLKRGDGSCR